MASVQTTAGGMPVLILREGTKENKGKEAQKNNITAAKLVAEVVKTSLGPRGMDKMLVDSLGDVTITNDGATILKEIDVQHPAAKMMVEVAKSVDNEVGDGTTSAVVLAGALIEKAEEQIAKTSMQTKLVSKDSDHLAELVVTASLQIADKSATGYRVDLDDVKVEKKAGGSLRDTKLIKGIVLDKEVVHGGMPKRIEKAKIAQ